MGVSFGRSARAYVRKEGFNHRGTETQRDPGSGNPCNPLVMPGLEPGIHVLKAKEE